MKELCLDFEETNASRDAKKRTLSHKHRLQLIPLPPYSKTLTQHVNFNSIGGFIVSGIRTGVRCTNTKLKNYSLQPKTNSQKNLYNIKRLTIRVVAPKFSKTNLQKYWQILFKSNYSKMFVNQPWIYKTNTYKKTQVHDNSMHWQDIICIEKSFSFFLTHLVLVIIISLLGLLFYVTCFFI